MTDTKKALAAGSFVTLLTRNWFCVLFSHRFLRCFLGKNATVGCTKNAELSISHRFFRCFPMCGAFRIGFYDVFADSRLFARASLDFHLYFSSVQGLGGGGDDVHANADYVLCFSC